MALRRGGLHLILLVIAAGVAPIAGTDAAFAALPPGTITTFAGTNNDGRAATDTTVQVVQTMTTDAAGSLYFGERYNRVRKVSVDGILSTVAGNGLRPHRGDGGPAALAQVPDPSGMVVDRDGNLFISDGNARIRKVGENGIITNAAGSTPGPWGDGGPAAAARLNRPEALATDAAGNIYVADINNLRLRRISPDGVITTVAGNGQYGTIDDGVAATSGPLFFKAMTADQAGNAYVFDLYRNTVRKIAANGIVSTVAGNGTLEYGGDGGPAVLAGLYDVRALAVDAAGNLLIADSAHHRIRRVDKDTGIITTVAGTGIAGRTGDGGPATVATINMPLRLAADRFGNIFVADYSDRIRKIDAAGTITNFVGGGPDGFRGDGGPATDAELRGPTAAVVDTAGNTYIADWTNHRVRRVSPAGIITTYAGTGVAGFSGDGGPAVNAQLNGPIGLAVDPAGNLYVSEYGNARIRKITPSGIISTFAGAGWGFGGDGGPATAARFSAIWGLTMDPWGNLYVADSGNQRIRKISLDGLITTVAGSGRQWWIVEEGLPALEAAFQYPKGVAADGRGNVFIADGGNRRIRKLSPDGFIDTVAGTGENDPRSPGDNGPPPGDGGPALAAAIGGVMGVVIDPAGNLFFAEESHATVRKVSPDGIISTVAGSGFKGFAGDGGPATAAQMYHLMGVALDGAGNLLVIEGGDQYAGGNRVRKVHGVATPGRMNVDPQPAGLYHPIRPARILDTRVGTGGFSGPVGPRSSIALTVTGTGGVPGTGVSAVVLNLAVTQPTAESYLTVFPSGATRPNSSSLNFLSGQTVANMVAAKVGGDGKVAIYNNSGATHLVADIVGWYGAADGAAGARFNSLVPSRLLDTRAGTGGISSPVGPWSTIAMSVAGRGGVPANGVTAVVLNLTATEPSEGGYLSIYASKESQPETSSLNFERGQTVANLVVVKVGVDGKVLIYNNRGTTHVVADVVGWYGPAWGVMTGDRFNGLPPERLLDTRFGTGGRFGPVAPQASVALMVTSVGGVPATGVSSVVLNLTATEPTAESFLTVYPSGATRPTASNLNFLRGRTVANLVVAKVGMDGRVFIYNNSGSTHVVVDVVGWYGA